MNKTILAAGAAFLAIFAIGAPANAQLLEVDSVIFYEDVFPEWPDSNVTFTDNFPTSVIVDDRDYGLAAPFSTFASRHDVLFSNDAGATDIVLDGTEAFDISFDITVDTQFDSPRREAGIRINNGVTGDALFIVNTDANEIAAFGGPFPFYNFNDDGLFFNNGDTINMRIIHTPPDGGVAQFEYIVDAGTGSISSGIMDASNLEGGILPNSTIGVYTQITPVNDNDPNQRTADPTDYMTTTFANFDFDGSSDIPGDFDGDGDVDGDDFLVWQQGFGTLYDGDDFLIWQQNFPTPGGGSGAAVPEPASIVMTLLALCLFGLTSRRRG